MRIVHFKNVLLLWCKVMLHLMEVKLELGLKPLRCNSIHSDYSDVPSASFRSPLGIF